MYREIADSDMAAGIRFASNELEARELTTPCSYDRLSNDSEWQFRAGTRLDWGSKAWRRTESESDAKILISAR